jgi:hypothetical protein
VEGVKNRDCHKRQQKHSLIPKGLTEARLTFPAFFQAVANEALAKYPERAE